LIPLLVVLVGAPAASSDQSEPGFSRAEIDQMLAPIALYPDALLSQILMASTYPLEIVEAARWSQSNPGLEGERAVEAVADKDWEPSVKALVAFPGLLARMNEDLDWTRRLGDAFLYQEAQVMDAVQELRERAYAAGNLGSLEHARARREGSAIVIEPASPTIIHVPYYYPPVVYGGWWWPAYPPVYWAPPPGYYPGTVLFWSAGIPVSTGFFFSTFHWPRRHIVVVNVHKHRRPSHFRSGVGHGFHRWRHEPKHRRGVLYRHEALNRGFGRSRLSGAVEARGADHGHGDRIRLGTPPSGLSGRPPSAQGAVGARAGGAGHPHSGRVGQARHSGGGNWRDARRETGGFSQDRPANVESGRGSISSERRTQGRSTGERRQGLGRGSFGRPAASGRVGGGFR
jgi:hypothetical protein